MLLFKYIFSNITAACSPPSRNANTPKRKRKQNIWKQKPIGNVLVAQKLYVYIPGIQRQTYMYVHTKNKYIGFLHKSGSEKNVLGFVVGCFGGGGGGLVRKMFNL